MSGFKNYILSADSILDFNNDLNSADPILKHFFSLRKIIWIVDIISYFLLFNVGVKFETGINLFCNVAK
jgi:hypothetical protein